MNLTVALNKEAAAPRKQDRLGRPVATASFSRRHLVNTPETPDVAVGQLKHTNSTANTLSGNDSEFSSTPPENTDVGVYDMPWTSNFTWPAFPGLSGDCNAAVVDTERWIFHDLD